MKEHKGVEAYLSKDDEVFAKKVTFYLGKQPNVSKKVELQLEKFRVLAISKAKINSFNTITKQEEAEALSWFKKHSMSWLNGVLALSLFVVAPLGLGFYEMEIQEDSNYVQQVKYLTTDKDYLESVYHQNADELPDDYLEDNGFI